MLRLKFDLPPPRNAPRRLVSRLRLGESQPRAGLLVLLMPLVLTTTASAQAVYGSIAGTVTDTPGGVMVGVAVTITSIERNTRDPVVSNDAGVYLKERLLPGRYEVRAELSGFKTVVIPEVTVNVDTQTKVDLTLEVGEVAEQVTVSAATALLKTDRADVATTFETKQLSDLPNLDRNFTRFLFLTPGTQQFPWQHATSENPQGSVQIMVNGQHFGSIGYQLDGTENRDPLLGIIVINPNLEAIAEAKITSQNYDAEFGQAIAGVISVQTKSGSNSFHGSLFEFYQDDVFQARNPFTQAEPNPLTGEFLPDASKHQFGGSFGGPIRRDRFFFFGDYSGLRSKIGGSLLLTVPTLQARAGNLSEYGVPIYDPATSVVDSNGVLVGRQPFANNVIPPERLSPQALALLDLIPRPNRAGIENGTRDNFAVSGSDIFDNDTFDVRLDGRLTERLNVFGRYSFADFRRDGPSAFGRGGGRPLVSFGGLSNVRNQSLAAGVDRAIGGSTTADLRFGFFRYRVNLLTSDFDTTPAADAGIPGVNFGDRSTSGLPTFFVEGDRGFGFGSRCPCPLDEDEKQFQIVGNITRLVGGHTVKVGVDVRRAYNRRVPRGALFQFGPGRTRGPFGGGLGLASFLLGDVSFFSRDTGPTTNAAEQQWRHFYYVQDTWRASSRLTINYGLRLDVINPQTVNDPGNGGFVDLDTGEIKVAGVGGIGLDGDVRNTLNWAPRLSVSYQAGERTVIRSGYGRSFDIGVFGSLFGHTVTQNLPVFASQVLGVPTDFESIFTLAQGPPRPEVITIPSNGRFPLPPGILGRAVLEKQRLPRLDAYNVTLQHQVTDTTSVEIGYVGNKGSHGFVGDVPQIDPNEPTLVGYPEVPREERQPFFRRFGWTQPIDFYCNCGENRYDSLQTKLVRRFGRGLSLLAHYTLQRATQQGNVQFIHDPDLNRGRPDWTRTHTFALATVYDLPFARGHPWLGGWQVNTSTVIQSGMPFEVTYREAFLDRDVGPNRPNLIDDPTVSNPSQDRWFNATAIGSPGTAFGRPDQGTFGNLPRNALRGPGYWRTDASLFKRFPLTRGDLELRVEAANVFNNVNLGNPDAEIGVPGNDNPNAGRIMSTAYSGTDLQRNLQLGLRWVF